LGFFLYRFNPGNPAKLENIAANAAKKFLQPKTSPGKADYYYPVIILHYCYIFV
jgi:hypothetical protein